MKNEKELLTGDRIWYHKVGAYTMCLTPLFIKWFPDVYVKDSDKIMKVRSKWCMEDYKSKSI
jgi:diaminopimelate decarboxylase